MATVEQIEQVRLNIDDLKPEINNLIDRGDCESLTPPAVNSELTVYTQGCTWERSSEKSYLGEYSYKFTKNDVSAYAGLSDNFLSNNLHGFVPGKKYTMSFRVYNPSINGFTYSNIIGRFVYFDGGQKFYDIIAGPVVDDWQYVFMVFQIPDITTGFSPRFQVLGSEIGSFMYIDDIKIYEGDPIELCYKNFEFSDETIEFAIDEKDSVNYASYKLINILIMRLNKIKIKIDETGSEKEEFFNPKDLLIILQDQRDFYNKEYNDETGSATGRYINTTKPTIAGGMI